MKNKYDYDFMEMSYILCSQIGINIKILDGKVYFETSEIIVCLDTKDEEIITLITATDEPFESIVENVLQLNISRLLSKKAFHRYIENKYPNSDYCEYATLFEEYKVLIENNRNEALKVINQNVTKAISDKEREDNAEVIKIKPYEIKGKLSSILNETIKEARELTKIIYKDKEYDYTKLDFLYDLEVVWVNSIREKTGMDKISLSFKNKEPIKLETNEQGKYYSPALRHSLIRIVEHTHEMTKTERNFFIVYFLLSDFKDIEIARALCTAKYKGKSIMDNRTFKNKLKEISTSDFPNPLVH
ncbi:hypothetical protein CVO_09440 [Sulfurimonas sp. CVO]|jgi:hypothetical protein|uniref:hypothetical protein n=1 Tax=Sulfurimonas sp. CVO TaxID=2283483 RepID=UPI00132F4AEA|nr:hypothetical protein [Sulfurimonas sp. CVO]QHG92027.1 hypothetical protein CVO_09440 [Sulfurimonas sp. CVO]